MEEFADWVEWNNIRVYNGHRPLTAFVQTFLALVYFDEPQPRGGDLARQERYRRAPWFVLLEWRKPA